MPSILMCFVVAPLFLMPTASIFADGVPIVILDFGLNDPTPNPSTADELEHTASNKPLLTSPPWGRHEFNAVSYAYDASRTRARA